MEMAQVADFDIKFGSMNIIDQIVHVGTLRDYLVPERR
jgi:hypothetical protein